MAEVRYSYPLSATARGVLNEDRLAAEVLAAGLPPPVVYGSSPNFLVGFDPGLSAAQKVTLDGVVAAHDGRPRRKRTLLAILTDLKALSAAQQTAVWNDVLSGTPPKWQATSSDQCVWAKGSQATTSTLEKQVAVAFFCRENVTYLVHPAFDASINVPGDEAYTP